MAVTLKHKVSTSAGVTPAAANLSPGEIGVNAADGRAFVRKGAGVATLPNVDDNNGRYIRHDTASQGLNSTQQSNARKNFGATTVGEALITAASGGAVRTTLLLNNVNNTSDADKPVSTAQQDALNLKANASATINDLRFTARAWFDCPNTTYDDYWASGAASLVGVTLASGLVRGFWYRRLQAFRNGIWFEVGTL